MSVKEDAPKLRPYGPANPYVRKVAELRAQLAEFITDGDWKEIALALIDKARAGVVTATKLLFQYVLGKPVTQPHPDRLDADEMATFQAAAMKQEMSQAIEYTPMEPALLALRQLFPSRGEKFLEQLLAGLKAQDEAEAKAKQEKTQPTVSKRHRTEQPVPVSATAASPVAQTESIRLVNLPDGEQPASDKRAANPKR